MENRKSQIQPPKFSQRIACLWFPNWPIQRLVVARPELRRQYLVLFQQDPRRGRLVAATSPLAMQAGVRVGMPLSEAKSLLQRVARQLPNSNSFQQSGVAPFAPRLRTPWSGNHRSSLNSASLSLSESSQPLSPDSPSFFIFEHDPAADLLALNELADCLSQFSPIVGLEQIDSSSDKTYVSSLLLDITGLERLFGGEEPLAAKLFQFVQALEYVPRLAIANTLGVAWGASRFGTSHFTSGRAPGSAAIETNSSQRKPNTFRDDPDYCLIIAPDDCETFLSLPIESLRLEPNTLDLLHQLGIETNEQLWQLPRAELAMRFGDAIHRRIDQATGKLPEPVVSRQTPTEFAVTQLLEYPTNHRETIEVIIGRLLEQISQQLRARQQGGLQWLITLLLVDEPPIRLNLNLFQASATASEIMPLIEMQLEQQLVPRYPKKSMRSPGVAEKSEVNGSEQLQKHKPSSRCRIQVQEIQVAVTSAVLLVPQQRLLFDEGPQLSQQALTQLINRLTSRLGQPQVVYPQLLSGAQPECSYRFRPLVDIHRRRRSSGKLAAQSHVVGRPLRIFNPAIEIDLKSEPTALAAGGRAKSNLSLPSPSWERGTGGEENTLINSQWQSKDGSAFTITQAIGPERIETGWWRGPMVCRDYWRVETDTGQSLWIYRDLRLKRWFLQGEF